MEIFEQIVVTTGSAADTWIALGSLAVAAISVFFAYRATQSAKRSNGIAEKASQAAQEANALSQSANDIAREANDHAQAANAIASALRWSVTIKPQPFLRNAPIIWELHAVGTYIATEVSVAFNYDPTGVLNDPLTFTKCDPAAAPLIIRGKLTVLEYERAIWKSNGAVVRWTDPLGNRREQIIETLPSVTHLSPGEPGYLEAAGEYREEAPQPPEASSPSPEEHDRSLPEEKTPQQEA